MDICYHDRNDIPDDVMSEILRLNEENTALKDKIGKYEFGRKVVGNCVHDLRNILMGVTGITELIQCDKKKDCISMIYTSGKRGLNILGILDESHKNELIEQGLDNIVSESVKIISKKISKILISEDYNSLCKIKVDTLSTLRAVDNLLSNAVKASDKTVRINISTRLYENESNLDNDDFPQHHFVQGYHQLPPTSYVELSISDNGQGISTEDLPHIFSTGFTRFQDGSGRGLAIVYQFLEENGAYIMVNSELNVGTTFKIAIPVIKKKLLVLEDDFLMRKIVSEQFREHGFDVYEANCIDNVPNEDYHAMLSDTYNSRGQSVLGKLRELNPKALLFCMSGLDTKIDPSHNVAGFYKKPFNIFTLIDDIKEATYR